MESSKKSKLLDDIIVSTNSKKIRDISNNFNINCPFLRPKKLASKFSHISETLKFSLLKYEKMTKQIFDYVVMLQPTSPKRQKGEIDRCIKKISKFKADSLISIVELDEPHPIKLKN